MKKQKVCIVGDGLTGLLSAVALGELDLNIEIFGNFTKIKDADIRTTALSPASFNFLLKFIEKKHSKLFWPCKKIDLFNEIDGKVNFFMDFKNNRNNLMYIIQNIQLKKILLDRIKKNKKIKIFNTRIKKIDEKSSSIILNNKKINFDCALLCVGRNSIITQSFVGKRKISDNFNEIAYTSMVRHNDIITQPKQYFFQEGPMAILPINKKEFSLVWSISKKNDVKTVKKTITNKLVKYVFVKNPKLLKLGSFPIIFNFNSNLSRKNVLVMGEGAYSVHPLAGQGFNLILRDIKELQSLIKNNLSLGLQIKDSFLLKKFIKSRKPENLLFGMSLNLVHKFFKSNNIMNPMKKRIMKDLNKFEFLKKISLNISNKGIFS